MNRSRFAIKAYNTGNEETFIPNDSSVAELEHKRRRNMKMKSENENRDEENVSRLDYELSSCGDLLARAMKPIRGQKQLLKRLYSDVDELLEQCTVNKLRRAVYEPCFISSLEGKKLAAHFISKIGVDKFWTLIKKVVTSEETSKVQCVNYGEVLLLAWKNAVKEGVHSLQHRLERIFMDVVYYALQHLRYNKKFMAMLESFGKARSKQIDSMIYRSFEPNLWRCLKAANETVRYNACCLFLPFYPLVSDDDIESAESVSMQQGIIIDLLKDDSYGIRSEACRRTLFILSTYFDTFPLDFIKQCLTQIIDVLSVDSAVSVRIAVYEGMRDLLRCGSALNACERALKCLFDKRGINDRCDHVRLAAFKLLNALVGHRFIKLSEVVKMGRILKVFALEESDMVRKEIAKLLLPFYMKPGLNPDEVIRRIIVMGHESEVAALSFHHIVIAENLMSVERAVQHVKSLVLAVYKALRSLEGIDCCETDETMFMCSESTMCETFVEPIQGDANEKLELWRSSHLLLNCLVVMWLPLRLILDEEKYAKENGNLRRLLTKLFKFAFLRYRNTSVLEAMMHLGKTLDDWEEGRVLVLQELLQNCNLDDGKAAIYLEAAISWDFLALLKFIDDAFETVKREACGDSPPKKREKKSRLPSDAFNRSLLFLDCMMKQPEIKHHLEHNYAIYVSKYYKALTSLRQLIMASILEKRFQSSNFTFENVIRGIRMQYILATAILCGNKDDEEELLKNMQNDVKWLKESLVPKFSSGLTDDQLDMMTTTCKTYIYLWTQQLKTYDTPIAFKAELCDIQWIDNMKNSRGAVKLLIAVIELFKNLIIVAVANGEVAEISLTNLSISIFKYLAACSKSKCGEFDRKNVAERWLSICNTLNRCSSLLTSNVIDEQARIITDLILNEFLETSRKTGIIQSPLASRLELNEVIDFWINKILLKHRSLRCSVLVYLKNKIENPFGNAVQEDEISCYGTTIQFLLLLRSSAKKTSCTSINSMRKDTNLYETCVEILGERLRGLSYKYEKNEIFLHTNALFKEL
ncbi:unnamed protein product [Litomosoides sigmodontis]|uniref:SCD domain-containing protein n=1 Tax=Litomosoides sigmodontis TaxID=42156 RepID=A0A3P6S638_LITSI|nr:unnamed protein product [Litomosoides sigmodontis]